jgi:5-methylcytosine-specific restriction endonuclease McrA
MSILEGCWVKNIPRRVKIFERDNYICQLCFKRGGKLQADHIKPFAFFPKLRFILSNGRTLCINCHKTTDTYLKNTYNNAKNA